jgi:hypothetical protein
MTRQGRKRDVVACLPPRRCVPACCHAGKSSHQAWAPIGCGEAGAHHACDTSSNFAIVHILPNTQRSEKVKRRKGKRASTVVASLCRSVRRRSIISQRWSPFCAIVVCQEVIVKLFEGLRTELFLFLQEQINFLILQEQIKEIIIICSKCWDLQDSYQQPIRRHEGANPAKKPGEQSRCKTLPCPMLATA